MFVHFSVPGSENADAARITQAGRISADTSAPYTPISLSPPQTDTLSTTTTTAIAPLSPGLDNRTGGTLVKSILAEFSKLAPPEAPRTPSQTKDIDAIIEENYMIMTPKKNTFDFGEGAMVPSNHENENEENPYVEMTQGLTTSVLDPYELVTFGDTLETPQVPPQMEPLYMELHNPKLRTNTHDIQKDESIKKNDLPDILLPSSVQDSKSDSSDADDEASKDLESLYSANPRFSLSDVFRPASYYLGASQTALPEQDSSDSELVSPPPIPRSPPPMEDFDQPKQKQDKVKGDDLSLCSLQTDEGTSRIRTFSHSQNSDSDVEYVRKDIQRLFKRRPVSEEYRDEVESLDSEFNSTDIKKYLEKIDDDLVFTNKYHDYENMIVTKIKLSSPKILHTRELSKDSQGTTYLSDTSESAFLGSPQSGFDDIKPSEKEKYDYSLTSAPYYYSDLGLNTNALCGGGMLKLNNQRGTNNGGKRDITHIVNPIRGSLHNRPASNHTGDFSFGQPFKLANELATRSASVDFLNLTDKSGQIDKKNVYESDTLKRLKVPDMQNPQQRNVYPSKKDEKFVSDEDGIVRRTHSLEGLLENVLGDSEQQVDPNEGSYLWEEDSIWRERLRDASQRHTKSLDDLDCVGIANVTNSKMATSPKEPKSKKPPRAITRDVVYVNDTVYNMPVQEKFAKQPPEQSLSTTGTSTKQNAGSKSASFIIDREKLRQWDLMSSASSAGARATASAEVEFVGGGGDGNRASQPVAQEAGTS